MLKHYTEKLREETFLLGETLDVAIRGPDPDRRAGWRGSLRREGVSRLIATVVKANFVFKGKMYEVGRVCKVELEKGRGGDRLDERLAVGLGCCGAGAKVDSQR